jgi:hypothetical protein
MALAVAALMVAGCGGGNSNNNGGTPTAAPVTAAPTQPPANQNGGGGNEGNEGNGEISVVIPPRQTDAGFTENLMDLNGRVVSILTSQYRYFNYDDDIDATPNETLDIMATMRGIGEDYNCTFIYDMIQAGSTVTAVLTLNRALGDTPWDIMDINLAHTGHEPIFRDELVMSMCDPAIRDIIGLGTQPWSIEGDMTVMYGRQFGVYFLMANSGQLVRSTITFNKDYMETFALGNFYDMVFSKTWTFDAFESICSNIVRNTGGMIRPVVTHRERYIAPAFVAAAGGTLATRSAAGVYTFVGHENDIHLETLNYLLRFVQNGYLFIDDNLASRWLADGEAVFQTGEYTILRRLTQQNPLHTEYSFGLLPIPIGPDMDDYVSVTHMGTFYYILNNINNPTEIASVLVAMANRLSKINIIETELDQGVQDMESARVLEMLMERTVIDYSRTLGTARARIRDATDAVLVGQHQTPREAMEGFADVIQENMDSVLPN